MNKRGEVVTGLLIGLAVGGIIWLVNANNYAAEKANREGGTVYFSEYAKEEPGESALMVFGPAAAGAGVGWLLDALSGGDKGGNSQDNNIDIDAEGGVYVTVSGNSEVQTDNDTDIREDNGDNR